MLIKFVVRERELPCVVALQGNGNSCTRIRCRKTPYPPRTDGKPGSKGRRGGGDLAAFRDSRRQAPFRHLYLGNLELRGCLRENFHGGWRMFPHGATLLRWRCLCGETDRSGDEETERFHLSHNAMSARPAGDDQPIVDVGWAPGTTPRRPRSSKTEAYSVTTARMAKTITCGLELESKSNRRRWDKPPHRGPDFRPLWRDPST
jgi:hypothetical protein